MQLCKLGVRTSSRQREQWFWTLGYYNCACTRGTTSRNLNLGGLGIYIRLLQNKKIAIVSGLTTYPLFQRRGRAPISCYLLGRRPGRWVNQSVSVRFFGL